ncbi:unnamed protein product, partial [Rotaria magnacalcarata]
MGFLTFDSEILGKLITTCNPKFYGKYKAYEELECRLFS